MSKIIFKMYNKIKIIKNKGFKQEKHMFYNNYKKIKAMSSRRQEISE